MQTLSSRYSQPERREDYADLVRMWKSGQEPATTGPLYPFRQTVWVNSCITAIARNVAAVPLVFMDRAGRILPPDHHAVHTFNRPNPYMSRFDLLHGTEVFLNTGGNCLWVPVFNNKDELLEIWVFGRNQIKLLLEKDRKGKISKVGWEVGWADGKETFMHEEILHLLLLNNLHVPPIRLLQLFDLYVSPQKASAVSLAKPCMSLIPRSS